MRGGPHAGESGELARREFLWRAGCLGATVLVSGCASLMTRTIPAVDGKLELPLVRFPELQQTGGVLRVRPGPTADPLLVLTLGAERYVALSTVCTHLGCAVEARGAQLICPCHGSTYDREGRVLQGPAERPLTRYATQLLPDGILRVDLGRLA